jgi:hypothetical protein
MAASDPLIRFCKRGAWDLPESSGAIGFAAAVDFHDAREQRRDAGVAASNWCVNWRVNRCDVSMNK